MTDGVRAVGASATSLAGLLGQCVDEYRERFAREPQFLVAAPGRVNLIGEHTDYNGGFVLPMAVERYVAIAAAASADRHSGNGHSVAKVYSTNKNEQASLQISGRIEPGTVNWASYMQGVIAGYVAQGFSPAPFDAVVHSSVPLGSGLSSSAALEVATATLLEGMAGKSLPVVQKALVCQEAEHRYAGVPCGIMDQFSSALCIKDNLMLLDCRSQKTEFVPFTSPEVMVLIVNSNVRHELTGGEYAKRRAECEIAAKALGVSTLRDASMPQLEAARGKLGEVIFRRARHVISEIERTVKAADAVRQGRWNQVGQLMYASHNSLRDDYEVSCDELDLLVRLAEELGESGGMIGSRMTGGGFGGCTVSLVKSSCAAKIAESIRDRYEQETGIEPVAFTSRPAQGARAFPVAGQ